MVLNVCSISFVSSRDALLRRLTLRFVLCRAALTLHTVAGRNPANLPTVFPELPKEVSRGRASAQVINVSDGRGYPCIQEPNQVSSVLLTKPFCGGGHLDQ